MASASLASQNIWLYLARIVGCQAIWFCFIDLNAWGFRGIAVLWGPEGACRTIGKQLVTVSGHWFSIDSPQPNYSQGPWCPVPSAERPCDEGIFQLLNQCSNVLHGIHILYIQTYKYIAIHHQTTTFLLAMETRGEPESALKFVIDICQHLQAMWDESNRMTVPLWTD